MPEARASQWPESALPGDEVLRAAGLEAAGRILRTKRCASGS